MGYRWTNCDRIAAKGALLYGLAGALWIVCSDQLLARWAGSAAPVVYQTYKGWIFIFATSVLAFWVLRGALRKLERAQESLAKEEAQLRRAHQRLTFHVTNSPLAVIEWDSAFRIRQWSPRAEEIFGWKAEEVLGKTFNEWKFVHEEDLEAVEQALRTVVDGGPYRQVYRNRNYRKDGSVIHCEWYGSFLTNDEGKIESFLSQVQDVTYQVEEQERRQQLETQIQHAQKLESLGVLAGGIAHDFNNLLVGILGNADMALMSLGKDTAARENIEELVISAQHAAELCKQMLAYSGKGHFVVEAVDINALLRDLCSLLQASISKRATLRFNLAGNLPAVEADASQLRQVFMNLIINASDALGDAEGVITIDDKLVFCGAGAFQDMYTHHELPEGEYVQVRVLDTGCGMDEDTQQKIFDPFYTTKFTGRGLGLAAVLGIVRGHGGAIAVKSAPGRGTTFSVLFPVSRQPRRKESVAPVYETWAGNGIVLVVDDEAMVRTVARRALEKAGFDAVCLENGRAAVDYLAAHPAGIVAVLLDLTMPVMGGPEALKAIRGLGNDLPVLVTSGYSEEESMGKLDVAGRIAFLQKPFRARELVEKLRGLLEQNSTA
ncbi:MAG: PAS domain S-box protein [Candidatus Hydrogenedentes bacterium]|nr:PAS domain S-box protein [Candidatus Hydrogenedentota bacterium]